MEVKEVVDQHMRIKYINEMSKKKQDDLKSNMFYQSIIDFNKCDDMTNLIKN